MPTLVQRFVNRASTPGGDGTTDVTTGVNRAYATLGEWNAEQQKNIGIGFADETHEVYCSGLVADFATSISPSEWPGVDPTHQIKIFANRANPAGFYTGTKTYSESHYRIESQGAFQAFTLGPAYTVVDGIQLRQQTTGNFFFVLAGSIGEFTSLLNMRCVQDGTNAGNHGFAPYAGGVARDLTMKNVIWSHTGGGGPAAISMQPSSGANASHKYYNVMAVGWTYGFFFFINTTSMTATIKNSVVFKNAQDLFTAGTAPATLVMDFNANDDDGTMGTNRQDMNENAGGEWGASAVDHTLPVTTQDLSVKDDQATSLWYNTGVGQGTDPLVPLTDIRDVPRVTNEIGPFAFIASVVGQPTARRREQVKWQRHQLGKSVFQ
jgi:hypothetical protein